MKIRDCKMDFWLLLVHAWWFDVLKFLNMCLYKEKPTGKILVLYHLQAYLNLRHQNLTVFKPCVMGKHVF